MLVTPEGWLICYTSKLDLLLMNNEAEYEALIVGLLNLARELRIKSLEIFCDSQLVVY